MSLAEISTEANFGLHAHNEAVSSNQEELEPLPLDKKILGGLAVRGVLTPETLGAVAERLQEAFYVLRSDVTNEVSTCIAYGLGIGPQDEDKIDMHLLETAKRQNHGMITLRPKSDVRILWAGTDDNKNFSLYKHAGPLALSNGELPHGIVYSLLGQRFHKIVRV
jgi:hypothetical protein